MSAKKILIVDDEKDILELLQYRLEMEGYEVEKARDGEKGLEKAKQFLPDFILLDIMMPGMDGIELCTRLRSLPQFQKTIIIILSARGEEYSEVAGFDAGADDYVVKPVKMRSLLKRLESLQRRKVVGEPDILEFDDVIIDKSRYLMIMGDEEIKLPKKEFELLFLLASNPNKVITREKILENVWGNNVIVVDRTIDVHIRRIRQRIGKDYIQTVKGVGYKFIN
ncbi:MAG: response regulator transcription factor [Bacteroidia bacterium]|nr:response regulator transcription factor [Bacteroidia bacterium]